MTRFEAGVTGSPEMLLKENGYSAEGQKYRIHIKCIEKSTKKVICAKKSKELNNFFNTL